jgi:hypothetical protein
VRAIVGNFEGCWVMGASFKDVCAAGGRANSEVDWGDIVLWLESKRRCWSPREMHSATKLWMTSFGRLNQIFIGAAALTHFSLTMPPSEYSLRLQHGIRYPHSVLKSEH